MKEYEIERRNRPTLRFKGELIAQASGRGYANGSRWTDLKLYKTSTGKFVLETEAKSDKPGEETWRNADAFETVEDALNPETNGVIKFGRVRSDLLMKLASLQDF